MRGVKRAPLWRIFQSSSKQFQSNILWPNNNKNFYTSSHLHFKEMKSNSLVNFPKLWNIFFFCDVILSKSAWKGSKLVFHVAMVIERWTWIVKTILRWSTIFWNQYLISKVEVLTPVVTSSTQKWAKSSKLVFHVPIMIETWKSIVKCTLRWIIRLWNYFLKILKF